MTVRQPWVLCTLFVALNNAFAFVGPPHGACRIGTLFSVSIKHDKLSSELKTENTNDDEVNFSPIGSVDRLKRAATFWSTAVPIIASYYGFITRMKLQDLLTNSPVSEEELEKLWAAQHKSGATKLADTITALKGFYVKAAQIVSTRQDIFPKQYTEALSGFTDDLDPMPGSLAKAIIESELLHKDEKFEDIFAEFDDKPLGSASIAQVHRAVLTEKYGNKQVAVKVQRPAIESKLLGDVANLVAVTKALRNIPTLPFDYYTVFSELQKQLAYEFDFVAEAVAMDRIYNSLARSPDGKPRDVPIVLPRSIPGLVSRRVFVMDYLEGVPLSRAREEMDKKGIDPNSPQAKLFGRKLLSALTESFGRSILETGFFHADPHPGNIFVLKDGRIGLIDFGQVKQISGRNRESLCRIMVALDKRDASNPTPEDLELIGKLTRELGVELNDDAPAIAATAVGMWMFDGSVKDLPGGYDTQELSPNSPLKALRTFPQDLVLVARSSILVKSISRRWDVPWSLAKEWAPIARNVLSGYLVEGKAVKADFDGSVRFRDVINVFRLWGKGRATKVVRKLPPSLQSRLAARVLKAEEKKARVRLAQRD